MRVFLTILLVVGLGLFFYFSDTEKPRQSQETLKPRPRLGAGGSKVGSTTIEGLPSAEVVAVMSEEDIVTPDISVTPEHLVAGTPVVGIGEIVVPEVGEVIKVPIEVEFKVDAIGEFNNSSYYLIKQGLNFKTAKGIAAKMGGHILTLGSEDEIKYVRKFLKQKRGSVWLGITDEGHEGTWTWINGEPVNWTNWNRGEPNNAGGHENVGELLLHNGKWNDVHDKGQRWLIVERD